MSNDTAAREAASTLLLSRKNINPNDIGSENIYQQSQTSAPPQEEERVEQSYSQTQQQTSPSSSTTSKRSRRAPSAQSAANIAKSIRDKIPLTRKQLVITSGALLLVVGLFLTFITSPESKGDKRTKPSELSGLGKKEQQQELSLSPSDSQQQGLSLEPEITKLPEIPTQTSAQTSAEIDELKEKIASLEEEITTTKSQLTEKEQELRSLSQSMTALKTNLTNTETTLAKIPKLEDDLTDIRNSQIYEKTVVEEEKEKSNFQILNEESIEIYGKVYYVGSIIKYDNKKYVIKKIDFNNGVFLQDGAHQIYRLPIKKK